MARYFLMRCADKHVVDRAAKLHAWPVSYGVLDKLNQAFAEGDPITLVFTVTGSGAFQGCARMLTAASTQVAEMWGGSMPACRVEWIWRRHLPYSEVEHLINPLSDPPQPVRAGKDGTEIEASVAEELIGLMEKAAHQPPKAAANQDAAGQSCDRGGTGTGTAAPDVTASPGGEGLGAAKGGAQHQRQQQQAGTGGGSGQAVAAVGPAGGAGGAGGMMGAGMQMPGLVGAGLMGMPDPFLMGMNPMLAMGMMNPMLAAAAAGMLNPMAAAMMMSGMPGMMSGMRPAALASLAGSKPGGGSTGTGTGTADAAGTAGAAGAAVKAEPAAGGAGVKQESHPVPHAVPAGERQLRDGPPPGFEGMKDHPPGGRYRERDEWYDLRYDGPRCGGYRDGPPFRDGPPPYGFRDGPPPYYRDGPPPRSGRGGGAYDWFYDKGPPVRPGGGGFVDRGPPPRDYMGPPHRGYDGSPPGAATAGPGRERERPHRDDRPDLLRMSYEEYVERYRQLKELQTGGDPPPASTAAGAATAAAPTGGEGGGEGKENGSAHIAEAGVKEEAGREVDKIQNGGGEGAESAEPAPAAAQAGHGANKEGDGGTGSGGGGGGPNLAIMSEDDYVEYCRRFSAQVGMPFDEDMVRQHYSSARAAAAAQQQEVAGGGGVTGGGTPGREDAVAG